MEKTPISMIPIDEIIKIEKPHLELIQELLIELTGKNENLDTVRILNDLRKKRKYYD